MQLTQNCNFRCKYCIYSETHNTRQRSHSTERMTWETAKKAIDFLREHSVDSPEVNIGFLRRRAAAGISVAEEGGGVQRTAI